LSIEEEELGENVADMIACSTDESLLRTPHSNAAPPPSAEPSSGKLMLHLGC